MISKSVLEIVRTVVSGMNDPRVEGRRGNRVKGVKFLVTKASERVQMEKGIQTTKKAKEAARVSRLIPPFNGTVEIEFRRTGSVSEVVCIQLLFRWYPFFTRYCVS